MWKKANDINKIPNKNMKIKDNDTETIIFPLMADIVELKLQNLLDGSIIPYSNETFFRSQRKRANTGDKIVISFIPKASSNVQVNLVMEDIDNYSGSHNFYDQKILREKGIRHYYNSIQIAILTGGETPYYKPPTKYFIYTPWADVISVYCNIVYLSEARYIKS